MNKIDPRIVAGVTPTQNSILEQVALQKYYVNVKEFGAKGDGVTDDTKAIQDAINFVSKNNENFPDSGGTVVIPERGIFIFTEIAVKSNVTFKSLGGVLKLKSGTCIDSTKSYYLIHTLGQNGVTLDNLIVDGNSANNLSYLVADTITLTGTHHVAKNCKLYNAVDSGIMFSSAKRSTLRNNILVNGRDVGIYVNDGTGDSHYENTIESNHVQGFTYGGIALKRICRRTIVAENTIFECGNGITLENASTATDYSKDLTIVNNRLRRIGYNSVADGAPGVAAIGIDVRRGHYAIVQENRIDDVYRVGIAIQGTQYANVSKNTLVLTPDSEQQSIGIIMQDRDGEGNLYNSVNDNKVIGARRFGLQLRASSNSQYNDVKGNTAVMGSNPLNGNYALRIETGWSFNRLSGNTLNGQFDIEVATGSHNNMLHDNIYVNNTIAGNVEQALQSIYLKLKDRRVSCGTSAPTGTSYAWGAGDIIFNISPVAGGYVGWTCTVAGSPGTWKGFGLIQA